MPYLILSTVALLSNIYKNAPLIVGDKDSDPELMRFLGARITCGYPTYESTPLYVLHASPRTVFDKLEKRGYCLVSSQTVKDHAVWIFSTPMLTQDDLAETARVGQNDKAVQAFENDNSSGPGTHINIDGDDD